MNTVSRGRTSGSNRKVFLTGPSTTKRWIQSEEVNMRVRLVAVALAAMLVLQESAPARAGVLPFATEFTQVLNYGQLVNQYLGQGSQLAEALRQTSDMVRNPQVLTSQVFGPIMADINSLASVVQGGMALAYSMADLDAQFRSGFRGYAYNARTYF